MIEPRRIAAAAHDAGVSISRLLLVVLGPPLLWSLHLLASYFFLTLDCISAWDGGAWAIGAVTLAFALASAGAGWLGWRMRRRLAREDLPAEHAHWIRFLLVLGIGGAVIFTAVILLEAAPPLFTDLCA